MPLKGKKKGQGRRLRRRQYRRRKLMNLTQQVIPHVAYRKLRYAHSGDLYMPNTFSDQHVFGLNSVYDPDVTDVGHQPYGFDQMMTLYNKCTVIGAKVKIITRPGTNSNSFAVNVAAEISDLTSIQYPGTLINEKPGVKTQYWPATYNNVGPTPAVKTMTLYWSAAKWFRTKSRSGLISNSDYDNTSSYGPQKLARLYLTMQGAQLEQMTASLQCDVIIDYICVFHNAKQLTQS